MSKKKPAAEPDKALLARPPWLASEKERRWPLTGHAKRAHHDAQTANPQSPSREVDDEIPPAPVDSARAADLGDNHPPEQVDPAIRNVAGPGEEPAELRYLAEPAPAVPAADDPAPALTSAPGEAEPRRPRHARPDDGPYPPPTPVESHNLNSDITMAESPTLGPTPEPLQSIAFPNRLPVTYQAPTDDSPPEPTPSTEPPHAQDSPTFNHSATPDPSITNARSASDPLAQDEPAKSVATQHPAPMWQPPAPLVDPAPNSEPDAVNHSLASQPPALPAEPELHENAHRTDDAPTGMDYRQPENEQPKPSVAQDILTSPAAEADEIEQRAAALPAKTQARQTTATEPEPSVEPLASDQSEPVVTHAPAPMWQPPTPLPAPKPDEVMHRIEAPINSRQDESEPVARHDPASTTPVEDNAPLQSAEPDEIDQRAAALLAALQARRARVDEPVTDDISDDDGDPGDISDPIAPVGAQAPAPAWEPPSPLPTPEPEELPESIVAQASQPAEGSPTPPVQDTAQQQSAAPDEVEQRAAAMLAAMQAKRSPLAATEPDAADPMRSDIDSSTEDLQPHEPTATTAAPVEQLAVADQNLSHSVEQGHPEQGNIDPDPVREHGAAPVAEANDADAGAGQLDSPSPRKLALPPWQLPGATASEQYEQFEPEESFTDDELRFPARDERQNQASSAESATTPPSVIAHPAAMPQQQPGPPPPPPPPWPRFPDGRPMPPPPPGWRPPPPPPGWVNPSRVPGNQPGPHQGGPPQRAAPPPSYRPPQAYRVPPPLDDAALTNRHLNAPQIGWRSAVHKATGGHVNLGPSSREQLRRDIIEQIRQPINGDFRIAVLSIKGGVGKTTTTLGLGSALASVRHDRVIAVDANPDRGTLAERVRDSSTRSTVRDLLRDNLIRSYADVRNHTLMASSRLEVLASEQEPAVSEVFGDADYRRTVDILRHYYNIILTDCGTGIMHSAMSGILDLAHTIVLVSAPAMDAARSAAATLDWLMQHGHTGLVRNARVVFSASRPGSANLKIDKLYEHFETRCRSVHMIPFDPHLSEGADVNFDVLRQETTDAYLDLAASVSEDFGRLRGPER